MMSISACVGKRSCGMFGVPGFLCYDYEDYSMTMSINLDFVCVFWGGG